MKTRSVKMNYVSTILATPVPKVVCRYCESDCAWAHAHFSGGWYLLESVPSTSEPGKVIPLFGKPHMCQKTED